MSDLVVIKSFPNGISLHMDAQAPFEDILTQIGQKFRDGASFFGNASMALSFVGRVISAEETKAVLEQIRNNSKLHIVCIVEKDEMTNKTFVKALGQLAQKQEPVEKKMFYRCNLEHSQVLESEESIVILGDVQEGSSVISDRNIFVLGSLYGFAHAGAKGNTGASVIALEMAPEILKIADVEYVSKKRKGKTKILPKMAIIRNKKIAFEEITKETLDNF